MQVHVCHAGRASQEKLVEAVEHMDVDEVERCLEGGVNANKSIDEHPDLRLKRCCVCVCVCVCVRVCACVSVWKGRQRGKERRERPVSIFWAGVGSSNFKHFLASGRRT